MPKPTYEELWNKTIILEKENQRLSQTVEMLKKDAWIYQKLIESVNSIILRMDPQGNVKSINAFAQEFSDTLKRKFSDKMSSARLSLKPSHPDEI
jgi:hypothetical protein